MTDSPAISDLQKALGESEDLLGSLVSPMTDAELEGPAYPSEWSIAQTVSHLGSASVIFDQVIRSGLANEPIEDLQTNEAIWADWDAKTPHDQAHDGLAAIAAFGGFVDRISTKDQAGLEIEMFGGMRRLPDILSMRLNEFAVHTWDVAVARDNGATILPSSVELLVDNLELVVQYTARPPAEPVEVAVTTTGPDRIFTLTGSSDGVQVTSEATPETAATLRLSAEAWIRLVYGRLDPDHTPPVEINGVDLDTLRAIFPGP